MSECVLERQRAFEVCVSAPLGFREGLNTVSECTKIARFSAAAAAIFTAPPKNSEPIFWAGDPTKHFSVKKKGFSVKRGEGFSE